MQFPILFESVYSTRTFVLNRSKALNALNQEMLDLILKLKVVRYSLYHDLIIKTIPRNGINPNHVILLLAAEMDRRFVLVASIRALVIIINNPGVIKFAADPLTLRSALNFLRDQSVHLSCRILIHSAHD
jgi:hypothetical protein